MGVYLFTPLLLQVLLLSNAERQYKAYSTLSGEHQLIKLVTGKTTQVTSVCRHIYTVVQTSGYVVTIPL